MNKILGLAFGETSGAVFTMGLEPELEEVLRELKLDRYKKNFLKMKVIFSDLQLLSDDNLKKLVKDEVPRQRLAAFIKKNFLAKKQGTGTGEGWEIDHTAIKPEKKEKNIGSGGFGTIKTGEIDVGTGKVVVALKSIKINGRNITKEIVVNEVKVMNMCHHRNVLKCFGCYFSEDDREATICLEYLPEGDLLNFTEKFNVPFSQKLGYLVDVARGLKYLHSKNIVHRDIKPANILVCADRKSAKICDFGTSKLDSQVGKTFCGTPEYMPPEVFSGVKLDDPKKIDVYAYGILMWEVFCDTNPCEKLHQKFPGNAMGVLRSLHGKKPRRPNLKHPMLKKIHSDYSYLISLMEQCWDEDPAERPPIDEVYAEMKMGLKDISDGVFDSEEEGTEED